jgi:hypothetical protein
MRPADSSRVHTHPGPEARYVLAGEQCLEMQAGATTGRVGGTMTVRHRGVVNWTASTSLDAIEAFIAP